MRVDRKVTVATEQAKQLERKTGQAPLEEDGQPIWIWLAIGGLLIAAAGLASAYLRVRRRLRSLQPAVAPSG